MKITAADLRQAISTAKTLSTNQKGRTIKQNINQSLARIKSVPATQGTGLCTKKGSN